MPNTLYNEKVWLDTFIHDTPACDLDRERVEVIAEAVPAGVRTFLDAGVGGGYVYRKVGGRAGITGYGFDVSADLVRKLRDPKTCVGDIALIPFKDRSFDLVIAADVLEHVGDDAFDACVTELARVSRRYLLVNSPYRGTVGWAVSYCNACGNEFNIYGHTRSVDMKLIRKAFPPDRFKIVSMKLFGKKRLPRSSFLVRIARRWGKVYSTEGVVCPRCHNTAFTYPRRSLPEILVGRAVCAVFIAADRLAPPFLKRGSEIRVLIEKKDGVRDAV